jgi:hypothetical protein
MLDPAAEGRCELADRVVRRSGGAWLRAKADLAYAAVDRYLKG